MDGSVIVFTMVAHLLAVCAALDRYRRLAPPAGIFRPTGLTNVGLLFTAGPISNGPDTSMAMLGMPKTCNSRGHRGSYGTGGAKKGMNASSQYSSYVKYAQSLPAALCRSLSD